MNRFLIYTSNPTVMPKGMDDVLKFAEESHKYYFAKVKPGSRLANVGKGDHIISSKGNNLYVIEALQSADTKLIESYERKGLKRMNIKDVDKVQIVAFAQWCKTAHGIAASLAKEASSVKSSNSSKTMGNSIKNLKTRLMEMFTPAETSDVRSTFDGNVCVKTKSGWVAITDAGLVSYPDEMTIDLLPAYIFSKPVSQLAAGDILCVEDTYCKVKSYDAATGKIKAVTYTGSGKTVFPIKDALFNQTNVRVVVTLGAANNLFGGAAGGFNPAMLAFLKDGDSKSDLLPLLLMGQANGGNAAGGFNPWMLALLKGEGGCDSLKDIMMMQAFAGGANPFAGLFGAAPAAPAAE